MCVTTVGLLKAGHGYKGTPGSATRGSSSTAFRNSLCTIVKATV